LLYDAKPIPPALEVVAFARQHLALGLAILTLEGRLLSANPAKTRYNSEPHRFIRQA